MIAKSHRFHGHNSMRAVYRHSKSVRGTQCVLRFAPNPRRRTYRVAVVVSRKVHKSAVVRNRIRRRIYEQLRLQVPPNAAYDMVIIVFHETLAELPPAKLAHVVAHLMRPIGSAAPDRPAAS